MGVDKTYFPAFNVDTTQTDLGNDSPTITCTVGEISTEPSTFSYTIGDGNTTWAENVTTPNESVTTVSYYVIRLCQYCDCLK